MEGGKVLGVTPRDIPIDKASVASGRRTFQIKKDGHAAATFSQGDSDGNTSTVVALAPETARTVKSPHASGGGGRAGSQGGGSKTPPPAPQGDSDIRLKR